MVEKKEKDIWPKWSVQITEQGKIQFENLDMWESFKIPFYGKPMQLILKKPSKDRSRQEEKYYHAVVVRMVAEAMEISRQEAHNLLKSMFLTIEEKTPMGIRYNRVLSTTELTDRAYRDYWGKCVQWASLPTKDDGLAVDSGLNLYVPLPNEADYENAL